jgi:hypothetical protein
MKTRLVVVLYDTVTKEQNAGIALIAKTAKNTGFWHWFQHTWLLVDRKSRGLEWWRDRIKEIEPPPAFLIFNVDNGEWGGLVDERPTAWLHKSWPQEAPPPPGEVDE